MSDLVDAILGRRTIKPSTYSENIPDPKMIRKLVDIARHAPNHHRTEPARFYLLDSDRIQKVGQLFGEIVAKDGSNPQLVERGKKKASEWGNAPGLLIITCHTDRNSELVQKKPEIIDEDYATCCCICQNLLLLFEKENIAAKWSTGPVWEHKDFARTIDLLSPPHERVVALLFYGYAEQKPRARILSHINKSLTDYS